MPAVFNQVLERKSPEDLRETPVVTLRRVTTAAGAADGSTLIDSYLINLTDSPVQLTIVRRPDDPLRFEVRQIAVFDPVTGTITPGTVFASQVAAGEQYGICGFMGAAGGAAGPAVPGIDSVANLLSRDVVGNKADTVQQTVGLTSSLVRYTKALKTNQGDPSGHTLISWALKWGNLDQSFAAWAGSQTGHVFTTIATKLGNLPATLTAILGNPTADTLTSFAAKWGNNAQSFAAWSGDMSAHALTSVAAKWGNMTETLLVVLGARADATVQTTADASMHARLKGLLTSLGNPSAHVLTSVTAKWGDIARTLDLILGARWDVAGDLGTDIAALLAGAGNAPVLTKATLGASNFFAGAITIITLTPAGPSELGGVSVSHNGFTAGATITYRVYKMTNGVEDQIREFTRIVGTDLDGVIIVDSPDIIDGTGALTTWRLTAQSNNAGDNARTMRYQYTLKRII